MPAKIRQYRPITDEDKIQLALERFGSLSTQGELTSINELARRSKRAPAVISRAIQAAFKDGLVSVNRSNLAEPNRDLTLEAALRKEFENLHDCRVIEHSVIAGDLHGGGPEASDHTGHSVTARTLADAIHKDLGIAAASFVMGSALIQDDDAVGVGGGRAIYHLVDNMRARPHLRSRNVTLLSLTGINYAHDHTGQINLQLDADTHVSLLGLAFANPVTPFTISYPIVWGPSELRSSARATWLQHPPWNQQKRVHAFVGVGIFSGGHRLFVEATCPVHQRERRFDRIRPRLTKLAEYCRPYQTRADYCPVADIANHFLFVPPPQGYTIPTKVQEEIQRQIRSINEMLLTVHEKELAKLHSIMVIAGTKAKSVAIRRVLESEKSLPIRYLVTDVDAARAILGREE